MRFERCFKALPRRTNKMICCKKVPGGHKYLQSTPYVRMTNTYYGNRHPTSLSCIFTHLPNQHKHLTECILFRETHGCNDFVNADAEDCNMGYRNVSIRQTCVEQTEWSWLHMHGGTPPEIYELKSQNIMLPNSSGNPAVLRNRDN